MKIEGRNINLRLVELGDANFIYQLRMDKNLNMYLSKINEDIKEQIEWLKNYKIREKEKKEYYFIIEGKSCQQFGACRLYDFKGDSFSTGSWMIKRGSPFYVAIESMLLSYEIGFSILDYKKMHIDVIKGNERLIKHHRRFGARIINVDNEKYYFELTKVDYEKIKCKYQRFFNWKLSEA